MSSIGFKVSSNRGKAGPIRGKVRLCKRKTDPDDCPVYYAEGDEGGFEYVRAQSREYAKAILVELGYTTEETRYYR